jgi:transposase
MEPTAFFENPQNTAQKQYEALRAFYFENRSGEEVAKQFGYTINSFYSLTRDFKKHLSEGAPAQYFFHSKLPGRKPKDETGKSTEMIIGLRKKYLSVPEIKAVIDGQGYSISERHIFNVLSKEGFARLPRRNNFVREKAGAALKIDAPKSFMLEFFSETFSTANTTWVSRRPSR